MSQPLSWENFRSVPRRPQLTSDGQICPVCERSIGVGTVGM